MTPLRRRADDPGPDAADDDLGSGGRGMRQRRCGGDALDVGVDARRYGDRRVHEPARPQRAQAVGQRHRKRAAGQLDVRHSPPRKRRARGRELAVEPEAHHRQVVDPHPGRPALFGEAHRVLGRGVRMDHHVRPAVGRELQAAREVCVEHVEAARAETELDRLRVDEDDVALLDRAGQTRVGDAALSVDLQPDEAVEALADGGHRPPAQADRHQASRAASTSASVTSTMRSRSATAIRSSGVWMSVIPLARLTQGSPRALNTFASAAPPESPSRAE